MLLHKTELEIFVVLVAVMTTFVRKVEDAVGFVVGVIIEEIATAVVVTIETRARMDERTVRSEYRMVATSIPRLSTIITLRRNCQNSQEMSRSRHGAHRMLRRGSNLSR